MKKDAEAEQEFTQCIIAQQEQVWGEDAQWPEDGDESTGADSTLVPLGQKRTMTDMHDASVRFLASTAHRRDTTIQRDTSAKYVNPLVAQFLEDLE